MKKRRFVDPSWKSGFALFFFLIGLSVVGITFVFVVLFPNYNAEDRAYCYGLLILPLICIIAFLCTLHHFLSWFIITDDEITWKSPLRRTVKIKMEDCIYVGIEDAKIQGRKSQIYNEFVNALDTRGDALAYIYLSVQPYDEKYRSNIGQLHCKRGFIKFPYDDKACLALIEALPKDRTGQLLSFYNQMQANDRLNGIRKQNKKERREREKQKRKE